MNRRADFELFLRRTRWYESALVVAAIQDAARRGGVIESAAAHEQEEWTE